MMELTTFGVHFGAEAETFSGLGGFGDLVNTCTSPHSRNRKVGELIGQGKTVEEAMEAIGSVAECYYAAKSVKQLADREGLYLPIMSAAYDVLYNNVSPNEAVGKLMTLRKMDELGRGSGWFLD
jgi:glycerol-3-phosphate dehydrogenase (NAD(P)+)